MRRAAKVDDNQAEIVAALKKAGCSVQSLAAVGAGVPDLLVGRGYENYLIEVKDGSKSPSRRKLTADQVAWHEAWRGRVIVVNNVDEALQAVNVLKSYPINGYLKKASTQLKYRMKWERIKREED